MNREEQRKFKELKKLLSEAEKALSSKNGFSRSRGYIFRFEGEFAYWVDCFVGENLLNLEGCIRVKDLKLDEVFWDVFELPENRKQPKSFHLWGAFTSPFFILPEAFKVEIEDGAVALSYESYLGQASSVIDAYARKLKTVADIVSLFESDPHHRLNLVLAEIYMGHYQRALRMTEEAIAAGEHGGFSHADRSIYGYAKTYCEQRV